MLNFLYGRSAFCYIGNNRLIGLFPIPPIARSPSAGDRFVAWVLHTQTMGKPPGAEVTAIGSHFNSY